MKSVFDALLVGLILSLSVSVCAMDNSGVGGFRSTSSMLVSSSSLSSSLVSSTTDQWILPSNQTIPVFAPQDDGLDFEDETLPDYPDGPATPIGDGLFVLCCCAVIWFIISRRFRIPNH